jgi:hypothetical protein
MLHVVTLFLLNPDVEGAFVHSLRIGGDWHTLAGRVAPQLVATDLLRHLHDPAEPLYLCLDFWTSAEAYRHAFHSPHIQHLLLARRQMAAGCFELGAFSFPAAKEFDSAIHPTPKRA